MDILLRNTENITKKLNNRRELLAFYNALQRHGKEFKKIQEDLKWQSVASCVDFYYRAFKVSELYKQWKAEWKRKKATAAISLRKKANKSRLEIPSEFMKPLLASSGKKDPKKSPKESKKRKNRYIKVTLPSLDEPIVMAQDNPKRVGSLSFQRYEKYKAARTLREYYSLGARKGDA